MLSNEERARLSQTALARDMVADANVDMLKATVRDASAADVEFLAEQTLAP